MSPFLPAHCLPCPKPSSSLPTPTWASPPSTAAGWPSCINCPPLLKQWLDDVFTHGWAYGSKGKSLQGKPLACAVSLGSPAEHYTPTGHLGHTIEQMLLPFSVDRKSVV